LRNKVVSDNLIYHHSPKYVIHTAGKVGGLGANMNMLGEFYYDNIMMNTNIIESCRIYGVEKLICFLSTCVFPDNVEYPLTEEKIQLGPPHSSNFGYAYAKRMAQVQIDAYNKQYGTKYFSVIPCNIYGPNDNYNLENGHVIPSLIHKTYLAKKNNTDLIIWGSGKPLREFIYSRDIAKICMILLEKYNDTEPIILSTSQEITIREVVEMIVEIMGFTGNIIYDETKPDGQYRKPSDNTKLLSIIGDFEFTPLREGLEETIEFFVKNYNILRK
jgi:GDP-L-fucose synthase